MPRKRSATSRRTQGKGRHYRLQPDELRALDVLRERIGRIWNGEIKDSDMVGAALVTLERITRGDVVTVDPMQLAERLVDEFAPALAALGDETRREIAAQAADALAAQGVHVSIVPKGDALPALKPEFAGMAVAKALVGAYNDAVPAVAEIVKRNPQPAPEVNQEEAA